MKCFSTQSTGRVMIEEGYTNEQCIELSHQSLTLHEALHDHIDRNHPSKMQIYAAKWKVAAEIAKMN